MVRRGAIVAVVVLLLAGTSSYPRIPPTPVMTAPTVALAAETDRQDLPHLRTNLPVSAKTTPDPRVIMGAATSSRVMSLTFDLDANAQIDVRARAGAVWINKDALSYLEAHRIHATIFMTGMWAEVNPTLARALAAHPSFRRHGPT